MRPSGSLSWRAVMVWGGVVLAVGAPVFAAANSPLLAWRDPIYVLAGFAGIIAMVLLLIQPLLIAGYGPGLSIWHSRRIHRGIGIALVGAVALHVAALWLTSPPDVVDALLFRSPTPFSAWGVVAMWAVFAAALLASLRRRLRIHPRLWRIGHTFLAIVIVTGTIIHALRVEGTMETISKIGLSVLIALVMAKAVFDLRCWVKSRR